jgi:predicted small secreted protein
MKIKVVIYAALAALTMALSACNTTEGAGRDISSAGHAISEEANEHK